MKTKYRFIAVDVDGTLLDTRSELPPANREALHRAHEAGLTVCLCTGRSVAETRPVIDQLGLDSDTGVFVFGAIVSRLPAGDTVHHTPIAGPMADRLVSHFQSRGYPVMVMYDVRQAGVDYRFVAGERNADIFERWINMAPAKFERLDTWSPIDCEPVRLSIIEQPERIASTMADLTSAFPPSEVKCNTLRAPNYQLHVVECFAPQVSKWHGITELLADRGIRGPEVAAIGDDINDLEMIREAGVGIAMGNAIEPIRLAADWHAPSNDEAGVARAVDAILAGKLDPAPDEVG